MIDVIIPIYNANKTIKSTLESIKNQTIKNKVNIYLIDDNSSDTYKEIIDIYKDLNINYMKLEENSGPGIARQKGIDISNNEYIIFIDSDDTFYKNNSLEILYNEIIKGYDLVEAKSINEKINESYINMGDIHGKLYKRKFLIKNNIRFNNLRIHEDNYFNTLVNLYSPKKNQIDEIVYIYNYNKESLTNKDNNKDIEKLELYINMLNNLIEEAKTNNINHNLLLSVLTYKYLYINRVIKGLNKEDKEIILNKIDRNNLKITNIIDKDLNYEELLKILLNTVKYY